MSTNLKKQKFILKTLKPYFEDPFTVAIQDGNCRYLTSDGRRCAVGRWIDERKYTTEIEGNGITNCYEIIKESFIKEARKIDLSLDEWRAIQNVHDNLDGTVTLINLKVDDLEKTAKVDLTELKELLIKKQKQ